MSKQSVDIVFVYHDGSEKVVVAPIGLTVLEVAKSNDIPIEGACGGRLACSTCHVIVEDSSMYNALPQATEEEEDMLDLAFGLEKTSRLCCQLVVSEEMHGMRLKVPRFSCNIARF